jgi:hypothetical protein
LVDHRIPEGSQPLHSYSCLKMSQSKTLLNRVPNKKRN